jgi:hypothetical protein
MLYTVIAMNLMFAWWLYTFLGRLLSSVSERVLWAAIAMIIWPLK